MNGILKKMKNNKYSKCLNILELYFSDKPKNEILEKFCSELLEVGHNVRIDCEKYNVEPHIYNQEMIDLYSQSDAFIYELLVDSLKIEKSLKDDYIIKKIKENFTTQNKIEILCFGDGIGSDSLKFSKLGHSVTYFDVEGKISKFANFNFKFNKTENHIQMVYDDSILLRNSYDVVICREVLEHLEKPFDTVKKLRSYLKKDGLFFLSESFSSVNKKFPTHLSSNLKYVNKTIELIVKEGFQFVETYKSTNFNLFKKDCSLTNSRFLSIPKKPFKLRLKKWLRDKIVYSLS